MWMLLERVRFTLDSVECNKIGVSYEAFNRQPNFCSSPFWTCLHNQLWNFREVGTVTMIFFSLIFILILLFGVILVIFFSLLFCSCINSIYWCMLVLSFLPLWGPITKKLNLLKTDG